MLCIYTYWVSFLVFKLQNCPFNTVVYSNLIVCGKLRSCYTRRPRSEETRIPESQENISMEEVNELLILRALILMVSLKFEGTISGCANKNTPIQVNLSSTK